METELAPSFLKKSNQKKLALLVAALKNEKSKAEELNIKINVLKD